jgi:hypothetical protein
MGDDERRAPVQELAERLLDCELGLGVQRAGRLVEDHHRRPVVDRAGDRDALALAAGEHQARVTDLGLVAERQALDEVRGGRRPGGRDHASEVGFGLAEGDVASDGVVEHVVVLQDVWVADPARDQRTEEACASRASGRRSRPRTRPSCELAAPAPQAEEARRRRWRTAIAAVRGELLGERSVPSRARARERRGVPLVRQLGTRRSAAGARTRLGDRLLSARRHANARPQTCGPV